MPAPPWMRPPLTISSAARLLALTIGIGISSSHACAPPLSETQVRDLAAARDDADYAEQPFFALVESIRDWPSPMTADAEPIRLAPDFAAMVRAPAEHRGQLGRIIGEIVQQTPLTPPYEDVIEWFVRDERAGTPVIVYVVKSDTDHPFKDRERVQIDGRFYKRMHFVARDRKPHDYPAFVGRFPVAAPPPATRPVSSPIAPGPGAGGRGLDLLAVLAGPVAVLVVVLLAMRAWASRKARQGAVDAREGRAAWLDHTIDASGEVDDAAGLPDDPAAALAELRRRADAADSPHARDQGQPPA